MSYQEFYMRASGGSNLNSGTTSSDVGGGSDSAIYTSVSGNFDGTNTFTPTDGSTPASTISAGMYAALYNTGDTAAKCIALIDTVNSGVNGTIVINTTTKYGTVPTVNSGSRAIKVGGSLADLAIHASGAAFNTGTVPQSTRLNIKAGTYANTTTSRTVAMAGTATIQIWYRGYKTAPGDQDANNVAVAGTDIPAITFTTGGFIFNGAATHYIFSNLDITSAITSAAAIQAGGSTLTAYRIRAENTAANASSGAINLSGTGACLVASYFKATTTASSCVLHGGTGQSILGCVIVGGIIGINGNSRAPLIAYCVLDTQAGDAIQFTTGVPFIVNNSFYAPAGHGVVWTGTPGGMAVVANNYFENVNQASKAAINNTSGTNTDLIKCVANAYYNCTATISGITETFSIFDNGTLASAGFVNGATDNFNLNTVAQRIGFPGVNQEFEKTSTYAGYLSVGAVQPNPTGTAGILVGTKKTGGKQ